MKKRILFVDDEQNVLKGLQRSLRGQRNAWEMVFVESASEALKAVNATRFDAIVTDMRLPVMNGAQLLETLAKDYPGLIRIILSGHSDEEMIIRSTRFAHQFIVKPCDADRLKAALNRVFECRSLLANEGVQSLVAGLKSLPSIPHVYQDVVAKLRASDASLRQIGGVVSTDPAMTAKILQLVNSAFFGLGRQVSDCGEAVTMIGLDALKSLVLSFGIFSQFDQKLFKNGAVSIESLLQHSLEVGRLAQRIAQSEGANKATANECFLAGLLHDIGILILMQNFSEDYTKARTLASKQEIDLVAAEQEVFGTNHGAVGAYLLGIWSLADSVVEAVAFHHQPGFSSSGTFSPLSAVHVANALIRQSGSSGDNTGEIGEVDYEYLARTGLTERLDIWKKLQATEISV